MDIVIPALGESIAEATVARWLKKEGEAVAADEAVAELETDKVTVELRAPAAGVLAERRVPEGASVKIGAVVGRVEPGGHPSVAQRAHVEAPAVGAPRVAASTSPVLSSEPSASPVLAPAPVATPTTSSTPLVPPPAPPATVPAPGGNGHAAAADLLHRPFPPSVRRALREHGGSLPTVNPPAPEAPSVSHREKVVPMSTLRRRIAERLVQAQHSAAALTTFNEIDMTHVMALRERYRESFQKKYEVKLGFMSFFTKAVVSSLIEYPGLNAEVRDNAIVYKQRYDIGIAVGSGRGLVVPVLRDADTRGFAELERAIADYAVKARDNKLTVDDLSGGTFTITNGGIYGSMMSTPLLNYPQTGILGMHNITKRAVVVGDQVEVRPMMYVALTYDHRVVDGREAVQFLVGVKERIESPERLMFAL